MFCPGIVVQIKLAALLDIPQFRTPHINETNGKDGPLCCLPQQANMLNDNRFASR